MAEALIHEPVEIILVLVTIILIAPLIMKKINLPGLVGMLLFGIVIGPNALHILAIDESILLLSEIGLLYIMYLAGLEIDLKQFMKVKEKSILFGIFAIIFPWVFGFVTALLFSMGITSAILLGIIISSHTLIAYPIISNLGVSDDEAVTIVVGATIITDLISLIVLAILIGNTGSEGSSLISLLTFVVMFSVYIVFMLFVLPKILTYFFNRELHEDEEFLITLVVLFLAAFLAEVVQLEAIIGAFFAGLAINRLVPKHSRLMQKIEFLGRIFFIPIFIIYIGMLVDIGAIVASGTTILLAAGLLVSLFIGKYISSALFGRMFDYSRARVLTMYSLSIPQVGVTLATILVGVNAGLLEGYVLNAGILLMLITSTIPPIMTGKYAKQLGQLALEDESEEDRELTHEVILPIAENSSDPNIIDLAGILVQHADGRLYPIHVSKPMKASNPVDKDPQNTPEKILERALKYSNDLGIDVEPMKRVNENVVDGIINGIHEASPTMMMIEWNAPEPGQFQSFSDIIDQLLDRSPIPMAISRFNQAINTVPATVLVLRDYDLRNPYLYTLLRVANEISATLKNDLIILNASHVDILDKEKVEEILPERPFEYHNVGGSFSRLKAIIKANHMIIATIPPYFHTSSSGWGATLNTSLTQITHKMDNSLLLFNFPRKKMTLEVIEE